MSALPALFEATLANALVAALLALAARLVSRSERAPAAAHGLYGLALLKLVTPPLFMLPVLALPVVPPAPEEPPRARLELAAEPAPVRADSREHAEPEPGFAADPAPSTFLPDSSSLPGWSFVPDSSSLHDSSFLPDSSSGGAPPIGAVAPPRPPLPWPELLAALWAAGALVSFALASQRVRFVERLVRLSARAPRELEREARAIARRLDLRRCPELRVVPARLAPMLWAPGRRARVVLPEELLARLDADARRALLAHELAHFRRNDHRLRWLELVALGLHWWNPLARWCARGLRAAEEACCDAWVLRALPGSTRAYAGALVDTAQFLGGTGTPLPLAAGISPARDLERRLSMIFSAGIEPALTRRSRAALAAVALVALPFLPALAQQEPQQEPSEAPREWPESLRLSEERRQAVLDELANRGYRPAHTRYTALAREYALLSNDGRELTSTQGAVLDEVLAGQEPGGVAQAEGPRLPTLDRAFDRYQRVQVSERDERRRRALRLGAEALLEKGLAEEARTLLELAEGPPAGSPAPAGGASGTDRYYLGGATLRGFSYRGNAPSQPGGTPIAPGEDRLDRLERRLEELARAVERLAGAQGGGGTR